jgi:hypothetical protein
MTYKIVQIVNGRMVVTVPGDLEAWATANERELYWPERTAHLRLELQDQPHVTGLCGPMFDGFKNGEAVIRYEDPASNDILSK